MAYAQMPQFVSIHSPKIGCNELPMSTITQVLQSEPVQRLLQRQNVFLQNPVASSSQSYDISSNKNILWSRTNGTIGESKMKKAPELSVIPIMSMSAAVSQAPIIEDKHLLPSKYEGKSEVALVPIKRGRRRCGHYEPCESLVCDVNFQQFAHENIVSPVIAVNIEATEIDAPVSKHCKNDNCDAVSIDHDRCRRAIIRCHRCDITKKCDICMIVLKTRKSQMSHKNCKMKIEYRHNRTSRGQIMRDRMRQREIQIIEAARNNKNDYTDPFNGHDRAMESLQNNFELEIIPKPTIHQNSTIRITPMTRTTLTQNIKSSEKSGQLVPRFPIILPQQGIRLSSEQQSKVSGNSGSPNIPISSTGTPRNSYITITRMPSTNFIKPVNIANLLKSPTQSNANNSTMQYSPFLTPMCVVPIAGLKTKPSLQHHTQGLPKYCLVPESSTRTSPAYTSAQFKLISPQPSQNIKVEPEWPKNSINDETENKEMLKQLKPVMRRGRRKKIGPKKGSKSFECTFCLKKFSTDWYFKLHIAKHKGEIKFTCKYCKKPFMHLYNMTKHVVTMHKMEIANESSSEYDNEEYLDDYEQSLNCINCKTTFENIEEMEQHPCRIFCLLCDDRLLDGDLMIHLKIKHSMPDVNAVDEYERQKRECGIVIKMGRVRMSQDVQVDTTSDANDIVEDDGTQNEQKNGISKRKSKISNESKVAQEYEEEYLDSEESFNCHNCQITFETSDELEQHPCRVICSLCEHRIIDGDLMSHLLIKHRMSDPAAVDEYDRQKRNEDRIAIKIGRVRSIQDPQVDGISIKRKNRLSKRKRKNSNKNLAKRRKDSSETDHVDTTLCSTSENGDYEEQTLCTETGLFYSNYEILEPETMLDEY